MTTQVDAVLFEVDKPTASGVRFFAFGEPHLAALVEGGVNHDPGFERSRALANAVFDELRAAFPAEQSANRELADCRERLVAAIRTAMRFDKEFERHRNGAITVSVVVAANAGRWFVFNVGPNLVLHIARGVMRQVVEPHWAVPQGTSKGMSAEQAKWLADIPTAAVVPGGPYEAEIRQAVVQLESSDWLFIAKGGAGFVNLHLDHQPRGPEDLRAIVGQIAAPYAQFNRTWLAVRG